ncbi:MAG: serine/threonine-protein kinase, partial [Rhodothermales bacterium]|nr:serine/threonine-protein kinase [Rhodothermales bacterium]
LKSIILDFGVSKLTAATTITASGSAVGTMAYMAPEQLRGEPVDARADLWSVGVVLFELLAGTRPFTGEFQEAVIYNVLNEEPVPPRSIRDSIPIGLERIVLECLEKDPANRPSSAEVLSARLKEELSAAPLSVLPSWAEHRLPLLAVIAGAVAAAAGLPFLEKSALWLGLPVAAVSFLAGFLSLPRTWRIALFVGLGGLLGFFVVVLVRIQLGDATGNLLPIALWLGGMSSIAGSFAGAYLGVGASSTLRRYPKITPWIACSLSGLAGAVLVGRLAGEGNEAVAVTVTIVGVSCVAAFAAWKYPEKVWRWAIAAVVLIPIAGFGGGDSLGLSLVYVLVTLPVVGMVYGIPALIAALVSSRVSRKIGSAREVNGT